MKTIDMVIDLQYGSTGKGLIAGWLAMNHGYDTIMTAWAPNAGHTFIDDTGTKYVHTMLANGVVSPSVRRVMMGPGSILNLDKLLEEINGCSLIEQHKVSIFIHKHAAVVTAENIAAEQGPMTAIGSTKKGVGAAAISKIQRQPLVPTVVKDFVDHPLFKLECVAVLDSQQWVNMFMEECDKILIEGAQGYGLSVHHGFYPYTTSRDVTPMQILADCGVPFFFARRTRVIGTCRTFPIRVANRFDESGSMVGWSGPVFPDQQEINWDHIGVRPELTTVTKLPRRIFTWSNDQMRQAIAMCDSTNVFLNFVNYLIWRDDFDEFERILACLRSSGVGHVLYGIGPTVRDVIDVPYLDAKTVWEIVSNLVIAMDTARGSNQ